MNSVGKNKSQEPDGPGQSFGQQIFCAKWALRLVWNTAPTQLSGLVVAYLIQGFAPASLAWILKTLIDTLTFELDANAATASAITPLLLAGLLVVSVEIIASGFRNFSSKRLVDDLDVNVTSDILMHLENLDLEDLENSQDQDALTRAKRTKGSALVSMVLQVFETISSILQIVTLLTVLAIIQPWVLAVAAVFSGPFLLSRLSMVRRHFRLIYHKTSKVRWRKYCVDLLTNYRSVAETKLLNLTPLIVPKHREFTEEIRDINREFHWANFRAEAVFAVLISIGMFGLLIELAGRVLQDQATLGDFAVFFSASMRLRTGILNFVKAVAELRSSCLKIDLLIRFFDKKGSLYLKEGQIPEQFEGQIRIENLDFTYRGSSRRVISSLSLELDAGETIAIVGENGCGKTTLAKLIAKLYVPSDGKILLDGKDINTIDTKWLQGKISFVFQNFNQYEATAAENIAYGDWQHILEEQDQIEKIAQRAGVEDLINAMPDGYETLLGKEFGVHDLSLGQWQKMAVARAFAKQDSLLIFDEPSASIDARAEYELFSIIKNLSAGRTTILISHRFSTVSMADRILVMANGSIIEQGSHEELLGLDGHYAELFRLHRQIPESENK